MKILEVKKGVVTFISKDKEFEHLLQREAYKGLSNSYYFRQEVDLINKNIKDEGT